MAIINLPFGNQLLPLSVPDANLAGIFKPKPVIACNQVNDEIRGALANPIGSGRLSAIAKKDARVVILVDDQTRTTPAALILPYVLDELTQSGIPDSDIQILITHGTHRPCTPDEIVRKVGSGVIHRFTILQHDCSDESLHAFIGITSRGTALWINRTYLEADIHIGIGHIGPSPFAGYSGGGKLILPGISSLDTINANHTLVPLGFRQYGRTDLPCRLDIDEAVGFAPLDFLINVVQCQDGSIAKVFAGEPNQVFQAGLPLAQQAFEVDHPGLVDIAVTSGSPYDIDLYQAVRAVEFADAAVKPGGVILMAASLPNSCGDDEFSQLLSNPNNNAEYYLKKISRRQGKVTFNVLGYALARIRAEKKLYLFTQGISYQDIINFGFSPVTDLQETVDSLITQSGKSASVSVFPAGSVTIPIIK